MKVEDIVKGLLARHARPQQPEALCKAGDRYALGGDIDSALALFDAALQLEPALPRAWTGRAAMLMRQGHPEFFACIERALELRADYGPALVLKGDVVRKRGAREEALACYEKALAGDPALADAWLASATVLYELRRMGEAALAVEKFLAVAPEDHRELLTAQMMLAELERTGARARPAPAPARMPSPTRTAAAVIEEAPPVSMRKSARSAGEATSPGTAEKKSGRTASKKSMRAVKKSIRTDGAAPGKRSSRSIPAAAAPKKPGELDAEDLATFEFVRSLAAENRNVEALRKLEPIVKRCPDSGLAWFLRAHLLHALKQYDAALTSIERARRVDPTSVEAARLAVPILAALKKDDRALAAADALLALTPRDPEAHRLRGDCLVVLMKPAEASISYEKVIHYLPDDALAWLALGKARRQVRRFDDARSALTRALALSEGVLPEVAAQVREVIAKLPRA